MLLKNIKNSKYSNGFTLAEVLITLVIIGVIAAMTIPTLMKNTQNQELVTGLKKACSVIQQALINMGRNNDAAIGDYTFLTNDNFVDEFSKVANVIKKCDNTAGCFGSDMHTGGKYKYLNNQNATYDDAKSIITADGQIISFIRRNSDSTALYGISAEDKQNIVGRIIVDVNGEKGPNVVGRDLYMLYVVNGKGLVAGGANSSGDCSRNNYGKTCAGKVLRENAMNY